MRGLALEAVGRALPLLRDLDHAAGDDGAWSADLQARIHYRVIEVADQARGAGVARTWRAALAGAACLEPTRNSRLRRSRARS